MAPQETRPVQVLLTDFGLAKNVATGSKFTRTGTALGTPAYMSPEQARGETGALTPATDTWALGCVLYELLAARPAFDAETAAGIVAQVLHAEPVSPAGVPGPVRQLIGGCLAKAAGRRPPDAAAVRADCDRLLGGARPVYRPPVRWGRPAAVAAVLLAVAGLVTFAAWPGAGGSRTTATDTAPPVDPAEQLATAAGRLRIENPHEAEARLAAALALRPDRHDWRHDHALLLAVLDRVPQALEELQRIPATAPGYRLARLDGCLLVLFELDASVSVAQVRAELADLAKGTDTAARVAKARRLSMDDQRTEAIALLEGVAGWRAALVRAQALALEKTLDARRAAAEFASVIELGFGGVGIHNNRGNALKAAGDHAAALEAFDRALVLAPRHPGIWANRCDTLAKLERWDEAATEVAALLQAHPRLATGLLLRARLHARARRFAEALADATRVVRADPENVAALGLRGTLREQQGDVPGAIADLERALKLAPKDWLLHVGLAKLRLKTGRLDAALAAADTAVQLAPDAWETWTWRGRIHTARDDLPAALRDANRAVELRPGFGELLNDRGIARMRTGDLEGAAADYTAAFAADPTLGSAMANRGLLKRAGGDPAGARADFDLAVQASPRYAQAWFHRARLRESQGDLEGALADFTRAYEVQPSYFEAGFRRGAAQMQLGRFREAEATFTGIKQRAREPRLLAAADALIARCRAAATRR